MKTFKDYIVEPITPPTFTVTCQTSCETCGMWVVLNEYELRQLMVAVAKGDWPGCRFVVNDRDGHQAVIEPDGRLSKPLPGLSLASDYTLELFRIKREKETEKEK